MTKSIYELDPKDVIKPEHYDYYNQGITHFFTRELVHLNVNLFIIDYIVKFPFELFNYSSIFFRMVFENFFFTSVLIITRITTDQNSDFFTLPQFKNRIRNIMIKDEFVMEFDKRLREKRFDKGTRGLLDKSTKLRNERIAHITEDIVFKKSNETIVYYKDLISLRDQLNDLLDVISFGRGHLMLPPTYASESITPDIEEIFDLIVKNSYIFNLPEKDPNIWSYSKENLSNEQLSKFNQYRKKFGLNEI